MQTLTIRETLRFWDYTVSHAIALFRRPSTPADPENVDLVFAGVTYFGLPTTLVNPSITLGAPEDFSALRLPSASAPVGSHLFIVGVEGGTFHVVAFGLHLERNRRALFDSGTRPDSASVPAVTVASFPAHRS